MTKELGETGLSREAKALFGVGRAANQPTPEDEARILAALLPRLPVPSGSAQTVSWSARSRRAWKWRVAAGLGIGLAAAAALQLAKGGDKGSPAVSVSEPRRQVAPNLESSNVPSEEESDIPEASFPRDIRERVANAPTSTTSAPEEVRAPRSPPIAPSSLGDDNHLAEEVALLSRATSALRSGNSSEALATLAEHQRRFPRGVLSQQRHAARAQALCQLGRKTEAKTELAKLAKSSPLAARTRQACGFGD